MAGTCQAARAGVVWRVFRGRLGIGMVLTYHARVAGTFGAGEIEIVKNCFFMGYIGIPLHLLFLGVNGSEVFQKGIPIAHFLLQFLACGMPLGKFCSEGRDRALVQPQTP